MPHEAFGVSSILARGQTRRSANSGSADHPTPGLWKPDLTVDTKMS